MHARKTNRRWLTMLAALVAISVLGNGVGLIIHYLLHPVVEADASSDVMPRSD